VGSHMKRRDKAGRMAKSRGEEMLACLCDRRRGLREIISQMVEIGCTREHCRMLARECKEMGRLIRIGEVSDALDVPRGSLSRRLAGMGVTMPKAYTKRDELECHLVDRSQQVVPLGRHTDGEAGAAPGVGEGHTWEGGGTSTQFSDERGDGYKGDASRPRLTCANWRERRPGMSVDMGLTKSAKEGPSRMARGGDSPQ
jgi:hypothetical protein